MNLQEDFCSQELYELLIDKGFEVNCYDAPFTYRLLTHQSAMKWLREVHGIFIGIKYNNYYKQYKVNIIMMELSKSAILKKAEAMIKYSLDNIFYNTYEEAVDDSIKYSLEYLI